MRETKTPFLATFVSALGLGESTSKMRVTLAVAADDSQRVENITMMYGFGGQMNHLQLKAQRQALGLTVAEACQLVKNKDGKPLSKRIWQRYEQGKYLVHGDVDMAIFGLASHYTLLLDKLTADIDGFNKANPKPTTDNAKEYFEQLKLVKKLVLPFWHSFEQFKADTGNHSQAHWKIWQAVIGHLVLMGKLNYLDDGAKVPKDFETWKWLKGEYDNLV